MRTLCSIFAIKSLRRWSGALFILALTVALAGPEPAAAAPTVTATTPAAGATGVPSTTLITATFSEPMDTATISPGSVTLSQPLKVKTITAGSNYTLALRDNGTVAGWGYNGHGQATVPTGLGNVTAIAAGSSHSIALKNDGTVVAWGENLSGQCTLPAGLAALTAVAAGGSFTIALQSDKTVVAWGSNSHGQTSVPGGLDEVIGIAAGTFHALALKADGTVVAWGDNYLDKATVPPGLSGVIAVAAGGDHSLALKGDGTVVAWGSNSNGQSSVPAGLSGVVAVAAGLDYSLALKNDGSVVAWGDNNHGQTAATAEFTGIAALAAGHYHAVALKSNGTIASWGDNSCSQTTLPAGLTGVVSAAAGDSHTVALKSDGTLFAWGYNGNGQTDIPTGLSGVTNHAAGLGHTLALDSTGIVTAWGKNDSGQATVPTNLTGVMAVAAGDNHSVALKNDGTVVAWGLNSEGQATIPVGLPAITKISAGAAHTLALKQDGTVAAWGSAADNAISVPVGLSGVTAIAAAWNRSVALKSDGTVVTWGADSLGQNTVPSGLTDVIAIAAGFMHTVALKSNGTVVAWGINNLGQTTVPAGLDRVIAIAAGNGFTVAVRNDGSLVSWGDNKLGQATTPRDPYLQPVAATTSYSTASDSVTLTPAAALPPATTLTATVNTGVRSLEGTHPLADYSLSFTTTDPTPPVTTASPAGGTYSSPQNVTLSTNEPATIYYTTNGATPSLDSAVYSGPLAITVSTTLKFFARDMAGNSEPTQTALYTIVADTTPPVTTAAPAGGTYSSAQSVTLTANEPATIYYTTNGSTPSTSSPVYSGSIPIPANTVLKFFARDTAGNSETVKSATYTINLDTTPPVTTAAPAGGTYSSAQNVTLTANEPATIYYTTNGSSPTTSSAVYSGSIPVPASTTLKFFAKDTAGNNETVRTESYTIKQNQLIIFDPLSVRTYGSPAFALNAVSSSGLPVSYTSSNTAVATVSGNTVTIIAAGSTTITASQSGNATYNPATSVARTLTVNKAILTVRANNATRVYGAANPAFSATYSGFVNGDTQAVLSGTPVLTTTATVSSPAVTYPISAAAGTLAAVNYSFSFVNGTLTVTKANQTITFGVLPGKTYDDTAFTLNATASSGLAVSYTSSNPAVATVSGGTVTIIGAGTVTITASQSGDDNYNAAPSVAQSLTVNKATASVTLGSLSTTYDGTPKAATATTIPAGLDVILTYNGIATIPTAVASYSVIGTVSDPNYQGSANGTLTIAKGNQTITFDALPVKTYGDPAFTLTATASSGLPMTYASSNSAVATVSGAMVTVVGAGTATITATQAGDGNYNAAPAVAQTQIINKAFATISFGQLTFVYDGNPKPVTVTTVPVGLAVAITYNGSTTPPTESGNYTVVATVNDANYQGSATAIEEIAKKSQTITFGPLPVKTYGDAPFTFSASASSNLTLTFEFDPAIVSSIVKQGKNYLVTIVGAGTTVITATQTGNRNYSDAPPVSQTLTVNKAAATVTLGSLSAIYDGTAKAATATTTPAGLAVTYTYNGSAIAPTAAGSYSVVGTLNTANYQGSDSGTLIIAKANQAITFGALPAMSYGTAPFNPNAAATSDLAISYSSSNPAVATVSGTTVTIVGIGTTTITASQGGDGNYNAAASVPQTLTVDKGTATITLGGLTTTYNGTPQPITATTAPGGLPLTITYNGSATAPTAAGTYTVAATVTNPNYQGSNSGTLTISKATQTITFGTLPVKTTGNEPFTLTATATSGLAISYTSSNPAVATISGSNVTIVGPGTATITANQSGDGNYNAANSVAQALTVQASQASSGKTTVTIGAITSYFDTVAATFAAITPGSTAQVKLQTLTFAETVNLNISGATVWISGGFDSAFTGTTGMTTIQGNLVISAGTLVVDRLVIM